MNAFVQTSAFEALLPKLLTHGASRRVFKGLSRPEWDRVQAAMGYRRFTPDQPISSQTRQPLIGVVASGIVVHQWQRRDRSQQLMDLRYPGDFLSHPGRRTAAIQPMAHTAVEIFGMEMAQFDQLLADIPKLRSNYTTHLSHEITNLRQWFLILGQRNARACVAHALLRFWQQQHPTGPQGLPEGRSLHLVLSRVKLGSLLALKEETVSRQIRALSKEGILQLETPTVMQVRDPDGLYLAAGLPSPLG